LTALHHLSYGGDDSWIANDDSWIANDDSWIANDDSWIANDDSWIANDDSLIKTGKEGTSCNGKSKDLGAQSAA
jgi:hypothetical protein